MIERTVAIALETGLHARPAAECVRAAGRFRSRIWISKAARQANAASILEVLALGAQQGDQVILTADGPDEDAAIAQLVAILCGEPARE